MLKQQAFCKMLFNEANSSVVMKQYCVTGLASDPLNLVPTGPILNDLQPISGFLIDVAQGTQESAFDANLFKSQGKGTPSDLAADD